MKMKTICLLFSTLVLSLCSCGEGVRYQPADYKAGTLEFDESKGEFNILQLTDIHLSVKDNQQLQLKFLDLTISDTTYGKADLIVLDGDTFTFADKDTVKRFCNFMDSYNIPWTITFGNHDEQGYFSVDWLTDYLNKNTKNCVFKDIQDDDIYGNANFYINVTKGGSSFEKIIIMDSNRYYFNDYFGYDYIKQDQIDWYQRITEAEPMQSLMFYHIPLPEFKTAYDLWKADSSEVVYLGGENYEGVSCPKRNSGLFDKIVELGQTKGIFVGHDHENDSAFLYKGVVLSYGTNSTDRIYYRKGQMGGQMIKLKADHSFDLNRIHHEYSEVEGK